MAAAVAMRLDLIAYYPQPRRLVLTRPFAGFRPSTDMRVIVHPSALSPRSLPHLGIGKPVTRAMPVSPILINIQETAKSPYRT